MNGIPDSWTAEHRYRVAQQRQRPHPTALGFDVSTVDSLIADDLPTWHAAQDVALGAVASGHEPVFIHVRLDNGKRELAGRFDSTGGF